MQSHDGRQTDWNEEDKIYLALQLFQQRERRFGPRSSAAQVLFDSLATYQPDWEDVPLPKGKTVAQGRAVFSLYSRQSTGPSTGQSAGPSPGVYGMPLAGGNTGGVTSRKRPATDTLTPGIGRPLAPKQPTSLGPETNVRPAVTTFQPNSPLVDPSPRLTEPRKKRGRPTKQEAEERRRQMEERQQRRMQPQSAQTTQPTSTPHSISPFNQTYHSPVDSGAFTAQSQQPPETTPSSVLFSPPVIAPVQTPQRLTGEDQTSSGSSGKRRKLRASRLSTTGADAPPQIRLPVAGQQSIHESQARTGLHGEDQPYTRIRQAPESTESASGGIGNSRFEPDDDPRPPNRSRPWEVTDRSGS